MNESLDRFLLGTAAPGTDAINRARAGIFHIFIGDRNLGRGPDCAGVRQVRVSWRCPQCWGHPVHTPHARAHARIGLKTPRARPRVHDAKVGDSLARGRVHQTKVASSSLSCSDCSDAGKIPRRD